MKVGIDLAGATGMNSADELDKLHDLYQSGVLNDEAYETAKACVLGQVRETDVIRLDRAWARERDLHMVRGKFGERSLPGRVGSVINAIVIVVFSIIWIGVSFAFGGPFYFPAVGLGIGVVGVAMCVHLYRRAVAYELAYSRYQKRRALLMLEGLQEDDNAPSCPQGTGSGGEFQDAR